MLKKSDQNNYKDNYMYNSTRFFFNLMNSLSVTIGDFVLKMQNLRFITCTL